MLKKMRGIKIDIDRTATNLAPSPAVLVNYFHKQLKYRMIERSSNCISTKKQFVEFQKDLSFSDHPLLPSLKGYRVCSRFLVNLYNGNIKASGVTIYVNGVEFSRDVMSYRDIDDLSNDVAKVFFPVDVIEALKVLFTWHLYINRCCLEYINGGWMQRVETKKKIEEMKNKYIYLSQYGFSNILENTKSIAFSEED